MKLSKIVAKEVVFTPPSVWSGAEQAEMHEIDDVLEEGFDRHGRKQVLLVELEVVEAPGFAGAAAPDVGVVAAPATEGGSDGRSIGCWLCK